jgi:hypothetical protein
VPRRARTALLVAATAVLAGCAGSDDNSNSAPDPSTTGPLTTVVGELDLDVAVNDNSFAVDAAQHPDGHLVVLVGPESATNVVDTFLAELTSGGASAAMSDAVESPSLDWFSRVHVAPDGTVVIAGIVENQGPRIVVVPPGADEAEVVTPAIAGNPDTVQSALSPDGTTLYVHARWWDDETQPYELLALDVATGQVTATAPLPATANAVEIVAGADGTVTALLSLEAAEDIHTTQLATFDAALTPTGTTELNPGDQSFATTFTLTSDGSAVVPVALGPWEARQAAVLLVRGGTVTRLADLPDADEPAPAVTTGGGTAYLTYATAAEEARVGVVDLASGELVDDVFLCFTGSFRTIDLAPDGDTATALGSCDNGVPTAITLGRG